MIDNRKFSDYTMYRYSQAYDKLEEKGDMKKLELFVYNFMSHEVKRLEGIYVNNEIDAKAKQIAIDMWNSLLDDPNGEQCERCGVVEIDMIDYESDIEKQEVIAKRVDDYFIIPMAEYCPTEVYFENRYENTNYWVIDAQVYGAWVSNFDLRGQEREE